MDLGEAYRVLEVPPGAGRDTVREARNVLVRVWHPDRHQNDPSLRDRAEAKLRQVNEAYETIASANFPPAPAAHSPPSHDHAHWPPNNYPPPQGAYPPPNNYPPPPQGAYPPPNNYPPPPHWAYPPPNNYPPPSGAYPPPNNYPPGAYPPPNNYPPGAYPPPPGYAPPAPPPLDQAEVVELIEFATIAHEHKLWPKEVVELVCNALFQYFGRLPTFDELAARFGADLVRQVANKTINDRVALLQDLHERMGYGSPCHLCGAARSDSDPGYNFALARILEKKTNWGGALATLALNIVTLPLGVAVGASPGSSTTANLARCRLVFCATCGKRLRGFLGFLNVSQAECQRHPSWGRLVAAGYHTFLNEEDAARYS